jgi:dTDP-glucose pyrophosphorylase/predicted transcriptional regulator
MLEESMWRRVVMSPDDSIRDAFQVLDISTLRIALVLNPSGRLIGTVTDGDIRRGLLKGLGFDSKLIEVLNSKPCVVPKDSSRKEVLAVMTENRVYQVPVVDKEMKVIGLHLMEQTVGTRLRTNTMVIMAGGKGTRLLPITRDIPKPMLLISEKPIIEHIIERAKVQGFKNFVLAINHLGHLVENYFGDGSFLDVNIDYIRESNPLGTAGALAFLNPRPSEPIVVTNGDVITEVNYSDLLDFHLHNEADGTMAVQVFDWVNPYGVVETNEIEIIGFQEKPINKFLINAGIYVLNNSFFSLIDKSKPYQMPDLFMTIRKNGGKIIVYPVHEKWIDVGDKKNLSQAARFF